jgi:hypothetical protein
MKVTIAANLIFVDGNRVGMVSGRSEVYVIIDEPREAIARFKYRAPMAKAKSWVKFVFARLTVTEMLVLLKNTTPLELAWSLGYPKPETESAARVRIQLDAQQKEWANQVNAAIA